MINETGKPQFSERLAMKSKYFYPPETPQECEVFASRIHHNSAEVFWKLMMDYQNAHFVDGPLRLYGHPLPQDYFTRNRQGREAWEKLAKAYPHTCRSKTNSVLDDPGYMTPAVLDANAKETARILQIEADEVAQINKEARDKEHAERKIREDFERETGLPFSVDNYIRSGYGSSKYDSFHIKLMFGVAIVILTAGLYFYLNVWPGK